MGKKCFGKGGFACWITTNNKGVALLPFIDEERLLAAMKPLWSQLTDGEQKRNMVGNDFLFIGPENKLYDVLAESFYAMKATVEVSAI